jgi:hypothetical protein
MAKELWIAGGLAGVIVAGVLTAVFWTESSREQFGQYWADEEARVTCYSGGEVVYDGFSTGKVRSEANSDGYNFKDSHTGRLREVSGDCDIDYGAKKPGGFIPFDKRPRF